MNARVLWIAAGGLAVLLTPASAQVRQFDVPSEIAEKSIPEFARQAGIQVLAPGDQLDGVVTPAVKGTYDVFAALDLMLNGTDLKVSRSADGIVLISLRDKNREQERDDMLKGSHTTASVLALIFGTSAMAPALAQEAETLETVVVTGTLIRGVSPVGTNTITVDQAQIEATGATNTNQFLATIPTVSNAFNTTAKNLTSPGISTFRPNIRGLGAAGGNTTLVLIDGHNVVGAGVLQTTPDSGIIAPGMLDRVEILADGASSLYGADAVGGIVNFITKRKQDGVDVQSHYGFTDGYHSTDLNLTLGTSWDSGSVLFSLTTRENSGLAGAKRALPRNDLRPFGGSDFRESACAAGNVTAGMVTYALPGFTPGQNLCDSTLVTDIVPAEQQHGMTAAFTQQITSKISFDITAYGSDRITHTTQAQRTTSGLMVTALNPFFHSVAGEVAQSVDFSWAPVLGTTMQQTTHLDEWGVTPTLSIDLPHEWSAKAMLNYGWSRTQSITPSVNLTSLNTAAAAMTTATALNPYDLTKTNPAVIADIANYQIYAVSRQRMAEIRLTAEGPLFALPAGEVHLAVGIDYQNQGVDIIYGNIPNTPHDLTGAFQPHNSRTVASEFAELMVPVVAAQNDVPLVRDLKLDASVRHDHYTDFGNTINPKIGVTWEVIEGLALRGNYGTSFNAPSMGDKTNAMDSVQVQSTSILAPLDPAASMPIDYFRPMMVLAGGRDTLKPQKAHTWSTGFDWAPTEIPGLKLGLSYWGVALHDVIAVVPPGFPMSMFTVPAYQPTLIRYPTLAQAKALTAGMPITGATSIDSLYTGFLTPYAIWDARINNFGNMRTSGLDFNASYTAGIGDVVAFANLYGTYSLNRESWVEGGGAPDDLLAANMSNLQFSTIVGAKWEKITGSMTFNYSDGFKVTGVTNQTHVDAFKTVNLALQYDFQGSSWDQDLTLSLNIDNLFDTDPSYQNTSGGTGLGSTLGRFFNFSIRKKF